MFKFILQFDSVLGGRGGHGGLFFFFQSKGDDSRVMLAWDSGTGTPDNLTMTQYPLLGSQALIECFPLEALGSDQ